MRRELLTAVPPEEIREIAGKAKAEVSLNFEDAEPFHGMPRYRVTIEGPDDEVERFMERLRLARAGG
ncbi:TIGR04140 family protein [Thermococcus siculi]|uniref:TIGR04140 family protein n=1 Tax=Thermococcus siculi TaxID=72803 RepID=A0A2Z2MNY0_9EURY|nr:TIGR04140 family protein [Thermococcus siculi]ASJ09335.1 TIGR04140 family protein [Thermococcus siculi]